MKRIKLAVLALLLLDLASAEAVAASQAKYFTNFLGMRLVSIQAGQFFMGACAPRSPCPSGASVDPDATDEETPQHPETISRAFWMGETKVTLGQWKAFLKATNTAPQSAFMGANSHGDNAPVVAVSMAEMMTFIDWVNYTKLASDKGTYRLPTEAEWEYAARAGTKTRYWWGDAVGVNNANCKNCGSQWDGRGPSPVKSFKPNPWGLYEMAGTVFEMTGECAAPYAERMKGVKPVPADPFKSPHYCESGKFVARGGSSSSDATALRVTERLFPHILNSSFSELGFRLVRVTN